MNNQQTADRCEHIYEDCSRCLRAAVWRHLETGLCYCDGHAKAIEFSSLPDRDSIPNAEKSEIDFIHL